MKIHLLPCTIGTQSRIRIVSPYEAKDACANAGALWSAKHRFWTLPNTPRAVAILRDEIQRRFPGSEVTVDPAIRTDGVPLHHDDVLVPSRDSDSILVLPPWDHQRKGMHMIGQMSGCMLAWDMGSGKTKTVYDAIVAYRLRTILVVCPSTVVDVWAREAKKHVPRSFNLTVVELRDGSVADRASRMLKALRDAPPNQTVVVVVNYEASWMSSLGASIPKIAWDLVVADESHRIANHTTKACTLLSRGIGTRAKRRVCLSGTPLGNGPISAFGQFLFADPSLFGESISRFKAKYCVMGGFEGREIVDYQNLDDFKEKMGRITTRVRLTDVVDLPEFVDNEVVIRLSEKAREVYENLKANFVAEYGDGVVTATNAISKLLRLQQATSGYCMVTGEDESEQREIELGTEKLDALAEILSDAPPDEPIVVFTRFIHDTNAVLRCAFACDRPAYTISGAGNQIREWESKCDDASSGLCRGPVVAVQIQSGGVGIDLTRSRYCVYYSLGFSLVDYEQSRARVYRPGQTRSVHYYHLIAANTVDRVVYSSLKSKKKVVEAVIENLTGVPVP